MQLDLNLLTALDALLEEGSVAGAAARLHVTAPAMSRSLGRIRKATGDQILVRTGRSMVPTSRALAMRADVHALVQQAHHLLSAQQELDLTALDRVFTVRWHDALTAACGTALTTAVHRQAPGVRLRLSAEPGSDDAELRRGEVDLESSSSRPTLPDIRHRHVGTDRLVVAVRAGHPLAEGLLNPEDYAAAEHLTISRRGSLHDPIDDALATHGLERRVVAAGPTAAFALRLARETDLVVTLPDAVTRGTRDRLGLLTLSLPLPVPEVSLYLLWHQRYEDDRAHIWLRDLATETVQALFAPTDI
ncbi:MULTISPECIES: LysR family transcriptional regulator [Streptomyces]|uniref:LysR family transcriptional regulator n=1 Tax=Streptomyces glycanivorans TaxID=3033808 RepID=A0ABY9JKH5_9ACTN|nr:MULTISPECIES: LysR family transcriptional regulator [unclassified Streptomyces]WSQ81576.1 LysR family transcriptional regulator [Streptomyces sp. NBC_01213]TXS10759.1 LysR family transcriptional regulator [Streptomyces sp. wa22]WLQ68222.1 LysR family transcriptional regulator [Streptomyces sp. Alt3]WSR05092.1 LysR family transcriptional regulator [Streptomyces sp. NBC_01208]WSR52298.1 LysR family transcriptional regulator [Streptomyces sp. NBC_01201]